MRSLSKLEDFKDCIFLYALKRRLDNKTKKHWERTRSNTKIPKYEDLRTFLIQWLSSLETETVRIRKVSGSKSINSKNHSKDNKSRGLKELSVNATSITKDIRCLLCKEGHALVKCRQFQELPSWRRREQVRKLRACFKYLGQNYSVASCSSTIRCRHCQGEHNSLLHLRELATSQDSSSEPAVESKNSQTA